MSTTPPVPAPDVYAPTGAFVEPTRRYTYSPRVTYEGRYGASVVALVLGGYLLVNTNLSQLALGISGLASFEPAQTAIFFLQYAFAVVVVLFGLAVAPGAIGRRVIAVVVVLVLIVLWTVIFSARLTGTVPLPYASGYIAAPSFIAALAIPAGWLIVRERPGVTYLFLILSILAGLLPFLVVLASADVIINQLIIAPVALVVGVGIAWLARAVAGAIQSSHERSPLVDPPAPPA